MGHKLTGKLVGHGARDLLSPTKPDGTPNPYYNGGSEDLADFSKMSDTDAEAAFGKLQKGDAYKGPDGVIRTK